MCKKYFRKKDPDCRPDEIEWIEMTGAEFYQFVSDPQNTGRCFIDMGNVVLEASKAEYSGYRAEVDHSNYLKAQEMGWYTLSIDCMCQDGSLNGEELIADETQCVEDMALLNLRRRALKKALSMLPSNDYHIVMLKYCSNISITEGEIGTLLGLSQSGVSRRLKAIKNFLKNLVIEFEKSSQ